MKTVVENENKIVAKQKKERLFHISKRIIPTRKFLVINRIVSILASLIICGLLYSFFCPGEFLNFFKYCFEGATISAKKFSPNKLFTLFYEFAILLGISIALLPSFKMKFWNLGAEGQVLMGALCAAIVSRFLGPDLPEVVTIALMVLAGAVGGMIWALIPAIFRALFETNETLFTLMMNYIAMGIVSFLCNLWDPQHGRFAGLTYGIFKGVTGATWIPFLIILIIVLCLAAFVFVYLKYTKHGYELAVVGESVNTAKYIGINVKKTIIRTMLLSGALAGIVGWLIVAGQTHAIESNTVNGRGFTGVMITWLGHFDVLEILLIAFLVGFISKGSAEAATKGQISASFSKICIAAFFFTFLIFEFFSNYEIRFNPNHKLVEMFSNKKVAKEEK